MTSTSLKLGSRSSRLALVQVEEIARLVQEASGMPLSYELVKFSTTGDKDKTTPLVSNPGDDFFTDTLDQAVLNGEIDVAIHSAKDLPKQMREGLEIYALTAPLDETDAWVGKTAWDKLPAGSRVGTSSALRQAAVAQMRPDLTIVQIRGTIDERLKLIEEGAVDGIIVATCAVKRLKLDHLIKDIFLWEGTALQGQLAVVGRSGPQELKKLFQTIDVRLRYGKVLLVGAGPGDPELITQKAVKALSRADVVIYDFLVDPALLKYAPQAEHIYAGKRKGQHTLTQAELSRLLKDKAMQGKNVVRLKGGDPLIFGRGAEETAYLRSYHIAVDVIPGISAATGIPAILGIPLTARGVSSSVAFLSAHGEDEQTAPLKVTLPECDTIVFFMGLTKLSEIVAAARSKRPAETPIMVISNGTRPEELILKGTLATIESICQESQPKPPGLIVIGNVTNLYQPQPKKNILYTGTFPERYRKFGNVIHFPMIEIHHRHLSAAEKTHLADNIGNADYILLTSRFSIDALIHLDPEILKILKTKPIWTIGTETAASLYHHQLTPALIAEPETSEGLFKAIVARFNVEGKTIVFPRSLLPNPYLKTELTKAGAKVTEIAVYQNTKPPKRHLPQATIEEVIFSSPSTVRNFLADYDMIPAHWTIYARGTATQNELTKHGYTSRLTEHYDE